MTEYERFWSLVDIRDQRECWNWTGLLHKDGYGVPDAAIQVAFHESTAHRIACALTHARPFADASVLHSCDNPSCCNPRHLRWGTAAENHEDQRVAAWARAALEASRSGGEVPVPVLMHIVPNPKAGAQVSRQGVARLNADIVRRIRAAFDAGASLKDLAVEFGLTRSHVDSVAKRRIWRHVA